MSDLELEDEQELVESEPTSLPPDTGAWVWDGSEWQKVMTDTSDGVPDSLDLDEEVESLEEVS